MPGPADDRGHGDAPRQDPPSGRDAGGDEASTLERRLDALEGLIRDEFGRLDDRVSYMYALLNKIIIIGQAELDEIPALRRQLRQLRAGESYARTFEDSEPLVSVRIATYNKPDTLMERAIPSVLNQTYERLELIVVGDGCTDDTEKYVRSVDDERVRFVNLPFHFPYPEDTRQRWLVAGTPAANAGSEMALGAWIAPLDHDDEFTPDHIEVLLRAALAGRHEMIYGRMLKVVPGEEPVALGTYPPQFAEFGFQSSIYLSGLRFFDYNLKAWLHDEPGDWNTCRRMMEAGVDMGWVDRVVTVYHPSRVYLEGAG